MRVDGSSWRFALVFIAVLFFAHRLAAEPQKPTAADPLTAYIHTEDAERFARLFLATQGRPTAEQVQHDYLDNSSYGVFVFTPNRIRDAAYLADSIGRDPSLYRNAIENCLPRLRQYDADLRAIYLALHGLYPDRELPQIYVVFGAGNSGGTAGPGAQVLGLEVLCKISSGTPNGLQNTLRRFFAHETVHTLQGDPSAAISSPLLAEVLTEGGADFVAFLVTGQMPEPERATWAQPREAKLWQQFKIDLSATEPPANKENPKFVSTAFHRWVENYNSAPEGWPYEVGYWVGMRIWECYFARSGDKHQAMRDVLDWNDPKLILRRSGYDGAPCEIVPQ